jgi:hypothetical protein
MRDALAAVRCWLVLVERRPVAGAIFWNGLHRNWRFYL